ncbi:MAG TPA: phage major capsid protein [Aggregatilinea sp.]|uniref:phage major capsid protein n=1 Tax=Aggregatilinea sp. TaxID=2806333 RepID=UPI002C71E5CE|nr:phage major capsid protein [Aggregatilinea sp.]HML24974.1 phage major capsid protein [Aggregatilinea sp.]
MERDTIRAPVLTAAKALDLEGRIGGYLVVWGDATKRDLHGEFFTPDTELGLEWYPRRPVLYQHGLDGEMGPVMIGQIESLRADDTGVWVQAQLDLRSRWARAVMDLVQREVLGWSSGSLPHLVAVGTDGHIRRWPIVEGSLTPSPAEPRYTDAVAVKAAFEALGLPTEDLLERDAGEADENMDIVTGTTGRGDAIKRLPVAQEAVRPHAPAIEVRSKYADLDAVDMAFMHTWLSRSGQWTPSVNFMRELAHKAYRAVDSGQLDAGTLRALPVKSDELMHTGSEGFGQEWVPDVWSSELWRKARAENVVLPLFRIVEMPSNPFELPISGTDPTVYYVPETQDEDDLTLGSTNPIPDSQIGSGKVTLRAKKLALRVGFSAELAEDATLPLIPLYREQALRAMADAIDHVLLNGDTTTAATGNINSDDAAPSATSRVLAFDGLRKLPLVTNAANGQSAGGVPSVALLRSTRFLMDPRYALRPKDCAWIVDGSTYAKLLSISEVATVDKFGPYATVLTGEIAKLDGVPILVSPEMPLTQDDGKANTTGNTKGQAVCVYRPGWVVGYRRRIAATMDYLPYYDAYQMVATVRLAFAPLDSEVASVLYNITV